LENKQEALFLREKTPKCENNLERGVGLERLDHSGWILKIKPSKQKNLFGAKFMM
jgi:hypothetical protein